MNNYIIASNKPWHKNIFEIEHARLPGNWFHITDRNHLGDLAAEKNPRYIFFLHWSWNVPRKIWLNHECVCFHMTDLPYGRGGSPLQNLISRGHKETKLSALRMEELTDAGPIYAKKTLSLMGTAEEIYVRAANLSWEMIGHIVQEELKPIKQEGEVTIFNRRKPEEGVLPKDSEISSLFDHIRMLDAPTYPRAYMEYGDYHLEFSNAKLTDDKIVAIVTIKKENKD